jgi:hypothetical protein
LEETRGKRRRSGNAVTPGFKGQSRVHILHAPKKITYIIIECIEINVTITRTTCSSPVGGCETARVSSHMIIAQQVVGNNVA